MRAEVSPQWVRLGGRALVGLCLLLALVPPPLPWVRAALEVNILVDESLSMAGDFRVRAWRQVTDMLAGAPATGTARLLRFAAAPDVYSDAQPAAELAALRDLPRQSPLDGSSTNIELALRRALHARDAGIAAAIVLISDAGATHGDTDAALQAAKAAGVPVYLLSPEVESSAVPLRLLDVQVPAQPGLGEVVPVRASVLSNAGGPVDILLELDATLVERRRLSLRAGESTTVSFQFLAEQAGIQQLTVSLADSTAGSSADSPAAPWLSQTRVVTVSGLAPILYVAHRWRHNPVANSLALAGWEVVGVSPGEFMAQHSNLQRASAIVLDDVAINDMSESAWKTLLGAVQLQGKGLAVLGGAHSFGAGGYRHSQLEDILPVTAQASQPQQPAAVVFVLDRSGSMGRAQTGPSRFALARQAVVASVARLLPGDRVGVVAFANDAEIRLPLAPLDVDLQRLQAALAVNPAGGTRLAPALSAALQQLRQVALPQRILVLVTDGFAGGEDLQPLVQQLRIEGVTVVALAVGDEADHTLLQELTRFNGGRLLSVTRSATLPRLMSSEVASERAPPRAAATQPRQLQTLPFASGTGGQWPPLSAYMVSKARPDAQVYLQSAQGDPLLATGIAGAGRVAVLPAGLGEWAREWWQWPGFGRLLGGLMVWLGQNDSHAQLSLEVESGPGQLVYTIGQLIDTANTRPDRALLSVRGPNGRVTELGAGLQAPGSYRAVLPVTATGLYQATVHLGDQSLGRAFFRNAANEFPDGPELELRQQAWVERGLVKRWAGASDFLQDWPRAGTGARQPLLLLALFIYLLVLVLERGVAGLLLARARSLFSR